MCVRFKIYACISIFILFMQSGCRREQFPPGFEDIVVENILSEKRTSFYFTRFFGHCEDEKVAVLDFIEFKTIHTYNYPEMDYALYLKGLLFGDLQVNHDRIPCFVLDNDVVHKFESMDFNLFKSYYWTESSLPGTFISKETVTHDNINTVSYYMFKKGYLTADSFYEFGYQCFYYDKLFE